MYGITPVAEQQNILYVIEYILKVSLILQHLYFLGLMLFFKIISIYFVETYILYI